MDWVRVEISPLSNWLVIPVSPLCGLFDRSGGPPGAYVCWSLEVADQSADTRGDVRKKRGTHTSDQLLFACYHPVFLT